LRHLGENVLIADREGATLVIVMELEVPWNLKVSNIADVCDSFVVIVVEIDSTGGT
jgi:hypothetical protein